MLLLLSANGLDPDQDRPDLGSNLFAMVIIRRQKMPLARKGFIYCTSCIFCTENVDCFLCPLHLIMCTSDQILSCQFLATIRPMLS